MSTLAKLTFSCLRALPFPLTVPLAQLVFIFTLLLLKKYRQEISLNYERLTGKKRPGFWVKNGYELGKNCALMLQIGKRGDKKILDRILIRGENTLMHAYRKGRGVVVVSLHFGPWELLPQLFAQKGYSVAIATQPQRDPWFWEQFLKIRKTRSITITNSVADMKQALANGSLLGFLLDNSTKTRRMDGSWLWPEFKVLRTPFTLAAMMDVPVVPMVVYKIGMKPVVEIGKDWTVFKDCLTRYPEEWVFFGKQ